MALESGGVETAHSPEESWEKVGSGGGIGMNGVLQEKTTTKDTHATTAASHFQREAGFFRRLI
jgi:hypothetical protein